MKNPTKIRAPHLRPDFLISKADIVDLEEILALQYLAYQSEAVLHNNFSIPPLKQTFEEVCAEYEKGIFLNAVDGGQIVGSVRAFSEAGTAYIGKLIVRPEYQGRGIGTKLLLAIEREYALARYELFTSEKSVRTVRLYERLGYVKFRRREVEKDLVLVYMEKNSGE